MGDKRLFLAIDVDGVLADLMTPWLHRYNRDYNDNLTIHNILDWDVRKFTKSEAGDMTFEYLEDAKLYDDVLPIEGSLDAINRLREHYNIKFVTHATNGTVGRKLLWLKEWGFFKSGDYYIEAKDKSEVGAKFLIDDNTHNAFSFVGDGNGVGILFGQPWNHKDMLKAKLYFEDWAELADFLIFYANKNVVETNQDDWIKLIGEWSWGENET